MDLQSTKQNSLIVDQATNRRTKPAAPCFDTLASVRQADKHMGERIGMNFK